MRDFNNWFSTFTDSIYTYSYFTDKLWPDFNEKDFDKAIDEFNKRVRRFGKTDEQLNNN